MARAKLRRGIELVKLANRIEALKAQEEDPENSDMPSDATLAADQSRGFLGGPAASAGPSASSEPPPKEKRSLSKTIKGAIFREVVLAKVREMKHNQETLKVQEEAEKEAKLKSSSSQA
jgi:calcium/calmodulin-dependent protein kinase I